jgi:hypothetical protein
LPELSLSLIGEFYLRGRTQAAAAPVAQPAAPASPAPADPCAAAAAHWRSAEAIGTQAAFEDHLARFPDCPFAGLARARSEEIKRMAAAPPLQRTAPTAPSGDTTAQARGLFGEQDIRRIAALGDKHKYPIPQYAMEMPGSDVPAAFRAFVGVWASSIGFGGGQGRHAMIIVTAVDKTGRAIGYYVYGPPTPKAFEQDPAGHVQFAGQIEKDKLTFETRRAVFVATMTTGDRLHLVAKRFDGRSPTAVVEPVWRLVEAERTASARAPEPGKPTAPRPRTFKQEPPAGQGALSFGEKALVDDGTCPQGQIKEIVGGDKNTPRQRRCVARE